MHYSLYFTLSDMFDLGNSLVQGDASNGTYYLVLATLHVIIITDTFSLELLEYGYVENDP